MIKTFKKAIAIMLTLVFMFTLVPTGVLAEEVIAELTPAGLSIMNPANSRSDSSTEMGKHQQLSNTSGSGMSMQVRGDGSNTRHGYFQINFDGYEEILQNKNTIVSFKWRSRNSSSYGIRSFYMMAYGDICDDYDADTITYDDAAKLGLHTEENGILLYTHNTDSYVSSLEYQVNSAANIVSMLNTGYDDSIVTFTLSPSGAGRSYLIYANSSNEFYNDVVTISYNPSEINNQEYVNSAAEKLTWDIISSDAQNNVSSKLNLPKKFYGADITWTSTKEDVINPSSGEVVVKSNAAIPVTLTANLTYTNFLNESASVEEPLTFDVVVRDPSTLVTDERIALTNYAYSRSSASGNSDAKNTKYGYDSAEGIDVIRTGSSFTAYGQFDLSGYEEILANENTSVLTKFVAGSADSGKIYDLKAVLTADNTDVYINSDVTYNSAEKLGLHNDDRPILFIKSDGTVYGREQEVRFDTNKDALIQVLNEGTENSVVSLHFEGITYKVTSILRANSQKSGLFISYDKTEIDNKAYLTEVKNALTWNVLSKGAQDKVSADLYLPTKFKGANIVWETDGVVIKSSGEVDFENNKSKTVTIKAKMSYTNILNDTVIDEKTFEVTISDGTCDIGEPTLVKEADKFKASWAIENYTGSDITYYVYLAAYSNNELVGLTPVTYVAKNGIPTSIAPTVECKEGYTAKLIIIEDDKLTPLFKAIER